VEKWVIREQECRAVYAYICGTEESEPIMRGWTDTVADFCQGSGWRLETVLYDFGGPSAEGVAGLLSLASRPATYGIVVLDLNSLRTPSVVLAELREILVTACPEIKVVPMLEAG
jgi:hypothetical protein